MTRHAHAIWLAAVLAGCSSTETTIAPNYDPRVPLRVAVLPFVDLSEGDDLVIRPLTAGIDLMPVLSDDSVRREHAGPVFRAKFLANLERSHLDVIPALLVDTRLDHLRVPLEEIYAGDRAAQARALGEPLGADAVILGEVLEWDRSFYLVESLARVALRVEMRDTVTGELLFQSTRRDLEASGISKLPIVYSPDGAVTAVVGQSLKGLGNVSFIELSDDVSREIVAGLSPLGEERLSAPAPLVRVVGHSAEQALKIGDELVVVAIGSADEQTSFRVGQGPWTPMTETHPGMYQGSHRVLGSPPHGPLTVRMLNRALRATTMTVEGPPSHDPS